MGVGGKVVVPFFSIEVDIGSSSQEISNLLYKYKYKILSLR